MPGSRTAPVAASPFLSEEQAGDIIGLSKGRMAKRRLAGEIPEGVVIHAFGLIRYDRDAFIAWARSQKQEA